MPTASQDDNGRSCFQMEFLVIQHGRALAFFDPDELVGAGVNFHSDIFTWFKRHEHQLRVRSGIDHLAEIVVSSTFLFNVGEETSQSFALYLFAVCDQPE